MLRSLLAGLLALMAAAAPASAQNASDAAQRPLKALLVTGGCCHNYFFQSQALVEGVAKHAKVEWTLVHDTRNGTRGQMPLYDRPDWAKPFDVVVHNECFADTADAGYIRRITRAHADGTPAVVIHCAMHTYRAADFDDWREFLGVTSRHHDHQSRYPVKVTAPDHPILRGFPSDWVTPMDELYIIEKLWPSARALATSASERDGSVQPVFWVNDYRGTRVFGTTYGHTDDTFRDPVFLRAVSRGLLWAAGRLE